MNYDYDKAFSRNLGWLRDEDQKRIREMRVAIPGLGGVGGHHLHGLLRLGFQNFNLADPDTFEIQNFNRQSGATCSTVGRPKIDVAKDTALSINPGCSLRLFPEGVEPANIEEFLEGVDIVLDALDLYAMDIRIALYERAYEKGIPVITAGPFGMGTSVMAFAPWKMSFNQYFDLKRPGLTVEAKIIRFLAGIAPNRMHRKYLRDESRVDLFERRLPSLNTGCFAASAALCAMVTEICLDSKNPRIRWAPSGFHVDFNLQKAVRFSRPWGNRNPLQWLTIKVYHRFFHKPEYEKMAK